ncbi:hypothetical protein HYT18_04940 [Candidatus Microgenomates bacterium]|nr:hypothetical protein [Candidatus Microgenomates bacterium]
MISVVLSTLALAITTVVYAATTVDVKFANHIQANLPEQDVFLESKDNPNQVVRVEGDTAKDPKILAQKVFAAKEAVPHDPFKVGLNPLGPYPKGKALGFTLEDWLSAEGSGTYIIDGDTASLDLVLQKLVPNGVYTVWCSRLTFPPNPAVVDRPCGAADGSENVFKADAEGAGKFDLKLPPLEESTKETVSVIALAYHSDGKTYGANPGDFGLNSHVQIFFLIPPAQAAESPTPVATAIPTQAGGLSSKAWLLIIGGVAVIVLGWWWFSKKGAGSPPTPEA